MTRMIEMVRASSLPSNLMHAAAKGALSIPAPEMIEVMVHLAVHNKVFGEQARLTLAGWDEQSSLAAASSPETSPEVLEYMTSPLNLRPVLLPVLLENPAVHEAWIVTLATSGSRDTVDAILKSARLRGSESIQNALRLNPSLAEGDLEKHLGTQTPASDDILPPVPAEESHEPDEVLDEALAAFLNEHAAEIDAEGNKPYQPIGGVLEELEAITHRNHSADDDVLAASAAAPQGPPSSKPAGHAFKPHHEAPQERGSALQKIAKLDIKGRIQLAMKGTKEERSLLIRDGTKIVALAVLESPKISDSEVEKFANQKNVLEAVLRAIPMKRRFFKDYAVLRNLVSNPRTPLDVSLGLMKHILVGDLRHLSANKEVSDTVRKLALKMFKQKIDPTKKGTD